MTVFVPFRFDVTLTDASGNTLARGAFSEVTGLEARMEEKALKEGGRNWGEVQLAGPVAFQPITLRRGVTEIGDLWAWIDAVGRGGATAARYSGRIDVWDGPRDASGARPVMRWSIDRAMPTGFKGPDLNGAGTEVAVEELTLVHEGLRLERRPEGAA